MLRKFCALMLAAFWFVPSMGLRAAEPLMEKTTLFVAGEGGYRLYRIPGVVVTPRGVVLAYCEARKGRGSDWDEIDVLLRRSADGGKSWDAPRKVAHNGARVAKNPAALAQKLSRADDPGQTTSGPVAIIDRDGSVHILYCVECSRCFVMHSDDDGRTWSAPADITGAFEGLRPEYAWRVIATGPGHGIQLKSGRLIVPVWLSTGTAGNAHRPSVCATIYSDDHGKTWHAGAIAVRDTPETAIPNETTAVELADGRVMLNVRSESKANRRIVATSPDGASDWSKPTFHDQLLEPICEASLVRLSTAPPSDRNRLLFSNPDTLEPRPGEKPAPGRSRLRNNLTVKLSEDEGKTWPIKKAIEPGVSGYSDLAVGPDGTIFDLYESGSKDGNIYQTARLVIARFNLEWLTDGRESSEALKVK